MSASPHQVHHFLFRSKKLNVLQDPGDGGIIRPTADLQVCEMVSSTTETRTLANPTKPGIRFLLRMLTDGGDIVVSAENGLNPALDTEVTFDDAGDFIELLSVTLVANTSYRWEILCMDSSGAIVSSTSPSASSSSSPSASASSSPSASASASPSTSPSASASHSPSSSPSAT